MHTISIPLPQTPHDCRIGKRKMDASSVCFVINIILAEMRPCTTEVCSYEHVLKRCRKYNLLKTHCSVLDPSRQPSFIAEERCQKIYRGCHGDNRLGWEEDTEDAAVWFKVLLRKWFVVEGMRVTNIVNGLVKDKMDKNFKANQQTRNRKFIMNWDVFLICISKKLTG